MAGLKQIMEIFMTINQPLSSEQRVRWYKQRKKPLCVLNCAFIMWSSDGFRMGVHIVRYSLIPHGPKMGPSVFLPSATR